MSGRRRSLSRPLLLASVLSLPISASACKDDDSNLEKLANETEKKPPAKPVPEVTTPAEAEADTDTDSPMPDVPPLELPLDGDGLPIPPLEGAVSLMSPGAEAGRVELRLALAADTRYRVTTIGMLKLPLLDKPTGFAREEDLTLTKCEGEGPTRSCLLEHTTRNFEAEPPTGGALEKDEDFVAELGTSHRIDASGLRQTTTEITGKIENPSANLLTQIHRLYCIRLPSEAVGVGATWRDVCRTRLGGQIVTRQVVWRLSKLEEGPDGTRAELEYAGRVSRVDAKGIGTGEVQGKLLFFVDAGEPHLMIERVLFTLDAERGLTTGTDLRYQFAKLGEGDSLLRTDGKKFEGEATVLNNPADEKLGDAPKPEAKPEAKPQPK